jgi:aminoglycoside 2'-N-acetyltransferase I
MPSVIVSRSELPEAVFDLLRTAFPEDTNDQRAFWPPDSVHALLYDGDTLLAHAGFVERTLHLPNRDVRTAYVEYVAASPRHSGHGTEVMRALMDEIERRGYTLAGLATGSPTFYSRLGWKLWRGPTGYRKDGRVFDMPGTENPMVLDLGANVDLDSRLECDWRAGGDIW